MELEDDFDNILAELNLPTSPKKSKLDNYSKPDIIQLIIQSKGEKIITIISRNQTKKKIYTFENEDGVELYAFSKRGNPLLKFITSVPWEYDDIIPDYEIGKTICILFLSLRYHNMNPDYMNNRLKELGRNYDLRVLLVQVDLKDPSTALKNLTRICLLTDMTLMLAWSPEEAAKIIENYKIYENKPPDKIMEKIENDPHQKIINALTSIKPVNKTDAMTLITTFGTLENIIKATESRLAECPGFGITKAKKLYKALHEPFLKQSVSKEKTKDDFDGELSIEDIEKAETEIKGN